MVDIHPSQSQSALAPDSTHGSRTLLVGFLAGLAMAVLWSFKLVDDGIGQNIAKTARS
ncbi:MAG: hypothetical protein ABI047_12525 [Jatrophihabitantaceae bacterium]